SRDTDAITGAVNDFITSFNALVSSVADKTKYDTDTDTKGPLLGDSTALNLRDKLFQTVQGRATGITSQFDQLADVGVTVGSGGQLRLDETRLRTALDQDPQGVADLFAARVQVPDTGTTIGGVTVNNPDALPQYSALGVASQMELLGDSLINSVYGTMTQKQ